LGGLWAVTLALIAGGIVLVRWMPAPPRSGCPTAPKGATMDHLARCDHAVKVTASSTDTGGGHDAAYLIDGRVGPEQEKWVSADGDRAPVVELEWDRPVKMTRVILHHAGLREEHGYDTREFTLHARVKGAWVELAHVHNNVLHLTTHTFPEVLTDALRLSIISPAVNGNNRARLFELEVR